MSTVGLDLEEPRKEGLKEIIYSFIVKCLVNKGRIPHALNSINKLLNGCMISEEVLKVLEVKFLHETDDTAKQIGLAIISIDWMQHALELKSGNAKVVIDKEDPLGSMSPAMSELSNNLRVRGIKHKVNNITWSVTWVDQIYTSDEL
jgi:hypothetical protein